MKLPLAVRASCLTLALFFTAIAAAQPRLPDGITQVTTVEGITEYRLDNGLQVLLFRDPSKATITVNMTYLVGSRRRKLRRDGHGASARAHAVQGLDEVPGHSRRDPQPRRAVQRHDRRGTARTTSRRSTRPKRISSGRSTSKSDRMVNAFVAQEDLDTEMTVVRNEFERGENSPTGVLFERVLSTAYLVARLRQVADRQPQRHRERADRAPAGVLSQALPARQRRARRRGPLRGTAHARADRPSTSARFRVPSASSSTTTRSSRPKTASARSSCAASATCRS